MAVLAIAAGRHLCCSGLQSLGSISDGPGRSRFATTSRMQAAPFRVTPNSFQQGSHAHPVEYYEALLLVVYDFLLTLVMEVGLVLLSLPTLSLPSA